MHNIGEWIKPYQMVEHYSMSRSTVARLLNEFKTIRKYKDGFMDLGHKLKLINKTLFEAFLKERSENRYK